MKQNYQKHKKWERSWKEKKRDGPENKKRGTVLKNKKEGRSWKEKKRDGPENKKRGTVLENKKRETVLEIKKRDGPGNKKEGLSSKIKNEDRPPFLFFYFCVLLKSKFL